MSGIDKFISDHVFNVSRVLWVRLENLKDDLRSHDPQAMAEANEIMDWLFPPPEPFSNEQKLQRVAAVLNDSNLSSEEQLMKVQQAGRSTGRPPGRPRDETSCSNYAIRALGLHLATGLSWREIAMKLKGCDHKRDEPGHRRARRRNPNLSCNDCGVAMRVAVYRLRKFLKRIGFTVKIPVGFKVDDETRKELLVRWGTE